MNLAKALKRHHRTLDELALAIERFDDVGWSRATDDGKWSPSEVYRHIQIIAEQFSFKNLEICLRGEGRIAGYRSWRAVLVMWMGRFPRGRRIKVDFPPEMIPSLITKDEARAMISSLRSQAESYAQRIPFADPKQSAKHFLLGWLRTEEWFRFAEMHHRHHLDGQLRRLLNGQSFPR